MRKRDSITLGLLLILIGGGLILRQLYPQAVAWLTMPMIGTGIGGILVIVAALQRSGSLAIIGSLVLGVGINLWLVPIFGVVVWYSMIAFLGLGLIFSTWFELNGKADWKSGLTLIFVSIALFMVFGGAKLLEIEDLQSYWPAGLIFLGIILFISGLAARSGPKNY